MAPPKTLNLAQRFLSMAKARTASPPAASGQASSLLRRIVADEPEPVPQLGLIRRFFQRRPISQSVLPPERLFWLPTGEKLAERIRRLGGAERIRLDYLLPVPPPKQAAPAVKEEEEKGAVAERSITVVDVKKVLRASQMESARSRLRADARSCVSYAEFLEICEEASSSSEGVRIARSLDESGAVIVLGDAVFLHPDQLARVIESAMPVPVSPEMEAQRRELVELEARKAEIDMKAEKMVKGELMLGLGFLLAQTLGFMRLTFWELSWDVMEPICFYVTSLYFMAGYTFFLRTSKEPSFEGFFQSRFATKQRKLMQSSNFDLNRFNELKHGGGGGGSGGGGGGGGISPCHYKRRGGAWVRATQ